MTYPQQPSEWSNPASWPNAEPGGPQTGPPDPTAVLPSADQPADYPAPAAFPAPAPFPALGSEAPSQPAGYPAGYPAPGAGIPGEPAGYPVAYPAPGAGASGEPAGYPAGYPAPGAGAPGEPAGYPAGYPAPASGAGVPGGYPAGYPGQASDYPGSGAGYPAGGQPGMPTYGYAPPYGYIVTAPGPRTNGLSIAAMVVALVGAVGLCAYGLGGIIGAVGAILGHVARRQIKRTGENGAGMALAGIIVGWIATAIFFIAVALIVIAIVYSVNNNKTA